MLKNMNNKHQKLELTWIGKGEETKLEPRILIENPEYSCGDPNSGNMLIHGDNLLALKALEQDFAGKVKCIYIDPPYNTGNAFEHYDDSLEHSAWLNLMKPRLEIIYRLLDEDGLLSVQIDDNEYARLYLLLAEIFHTPKNLKTIVVKMSEASGLKMGAVKKIGIIPKYKEYIILAKKKGVRGLFPDYVPKDEWDKEYNIYLENFSRRDKNLIENISTKHTIEDDDILFIDSILAKIQLVSVREVMKREKVTKSDEKQWLFTNAWRIARTAASTSIFRLALEKKKHLNQQLFAVKSVKDEILYIVKSDFDDNSRKPRVQLLFSDTNLLTHPGDLWTDIKTTGLEAEGEVEFKNSKKPESLLKRIIGMSTQEGDLVLDSFLGSGTTAAVAHKMGRRWIGIELGEHAKTHCFPRLKAVVDGEQGGISKSVNWKGGGGFRYYTLAPSLLNKDKYGNWVISKEYNPAMLAAAMAKQEGFRYEPDEHIYWKQGKSSEKDYIFTTTQFITVETLDSIYDEMNPDETLLIACKSFQSECSSRYPSRITIKQIPQILYGKCEFGKDNYSLNIVNAPKEEETEQYSSEDDNDENPLTKLFGE